MIRETNQFRTLFKKYRLRAEFATFSELGMVLAEKGLIYEDSIFSHWQKGDRLPNRPTIIKLIEIFSERQSINTLEEANNFLESIGEGYLTEKEKEKIQFRTQGNAPFQIPNQIDNFTGRENLVKEIQKDPFGKVIVITGPAGVGKSSLAIQLGYLLKDKFSDGVLWFKLDTSDVMDILLSIAFAFGKDIGFVQDREIRASIVRTILADKNVLLIFDNVELKNDIRLLLPNNKNCLVIITSQYTNLFIPAKYNSISLGIFNTNEALLLFKTILGNSYVYKNRFYILKLAGKIGFLPLPLHIFAKELKKGSITIKDLLEEVSEELLSLQELSYGNKNLYIAINFSYELIDDKTKKVFLSLAVFDGKDFSIEAVSFINELTTEQTRKLLSNILSISLIDQSTKNRYRLHPMIKKFIREKSDDKTLFQKAAKYYEQFLARFDKTYLKSFPRIKQESDNVLYIFKKCYDLHYWDEVITLWNPLETLLYATNQLNKSRYLFQIVKGQKTGINNYQKFLIAFFCFLLIFWMVLNFAHLKTSFWNYIWNFSICLVIFPGGTVGIFIARSWGFFKSSIGKAVLFLSLGLLSWGSGVVIWSYYNFFLNNDVPYPSWADAGFLPSYILWTIGVINLPHALGGRSNLGQKYGSLLFLIPIIVFALSYSLMAFITKTTVVFAPFTSLAKLFFDISYPAGDAIILSGALLIGISFKFFGGKYKISIYSILLGFCFQYIADFLFSYTTTNNNYYNGGIADLFFTLAMFFLSFGVLGFRQKT